MGDTLKKLRLDLKHQWRHLKVFLLQNVTVKQVVVMVICILVGFFLFITWLRWPQKMPNSAVSCKSKIQQMVWPDPAERKRNLEHLGTDIFTLENEYFHIVERTTHMCHQQIHLGPEGDGGWEICYDPSFRFKEPCLVYSFGIGHDFRFEKAIEKLFSCDVYAFDPSMGVAPHKYSEKGHFYDWGLDDADSQAAGGRWTMRRLKSIMKDLKHEGRSIDYMKLDIEFSEWPALHDMIQTGVIHQVRQLALEVHTPEMDIHERPDHPCSWSTVETIQFMLKNLVELKNAGFSAYYIRPNWRTPFQSGLTKAERYCCHNLHLINNVHKENAWKQA